MDATLPRTIGGAVCGRKGDGEVGLKADAMDSSVVVTDEQSRQAGKPEMQRLAASDVSRKSTTSS